MATFLTVSAVIVVYEIVEVAFSIVASSNGTCILENRPRWVSVLYREHSKRHRWRMPYCDQHNESQTHQYPLGQQHQVLDCLVYLWLPIPISQFGELSIEIIIRLKKGQGVSEKFDLVDKLCVRSHSTPACSSISVIRSVANSLFLSRVSEPASASLAEKSPLFLWIISS